MQSRFWRFLLLGTWSMLGGLASVWAGDVAPLNSVAVASDTAVRRVLPAFFGFNIEWLPFQLGYLRDGRPRPEVLEWLAPFHGAVYRYPGGDKANWFDWQKSVGAADGRRLQMTEHGQLDPALFGIDEFLDFVRAVNGVPVLVANLFGEQGTPWPEAALMALNRDLVTYINGRAGAPAAAALDLFRPCTMAGPCRVDWWELGNELDWKGHRWTPTQIVSRARAVAGAMRSADPGIRFVAFSRTGGFLPEGNEDVTASRFNQTVATELADVASAFSTHIYYEGRTIPEVLDYLRQLSSDLDEARGERQRIFVTEHARWPNMPREGSWQATWSRTGDLGGAIATADFLLGVLANPAVDTALWHQLGARGPWQLFYRSERDDHLWPSAVYWGLRVLRIGLQEEVLDTTVASDSRVWPGYAIRALVTRQADHSRYSLLAVNRSAQPQMARLRMPAWADRRLQARHHYVSGNSRDAANVEGDEDRVGLRQQVLPMVFDAQGEAKVLLPPLSISAFLLDPASAAGE